MKFLIVSHVVHSFDKEKYWGYGPYVREMNLWERGITELTIVAPLNKTPPQAISLPYQSKQINFIVVPAIQLADLQKAISSVLNIPIIVWKIAKAMRKADHIHLRCPGNMGLLGAIIQVFFPSKQKSAKYAGNWDWHSKQPWSYRLQQWILRNTFLTRNMQVLVYGEWPDKTANIKPFFTATYSEKDTEVVWRAPLNQVVRLIYVGTLTENKRPALAIQSLSKLRERGINAHLTLCGDGIQRIDLEKLVADNHLTQCVQFLGNVSAATVKEVYQRAHFLIFASMSEGWPKAVAEAMWWGCVPITTAVSCVPQMLGNGTRGCLVPPSADVICDEVLDLIKQPEKWGVISQNAMDWSRQYTIERFELEIQKILHANSSTN